MNPTDIARVCHEANRAYCLVLGDASQNPWGVAPEWQRASAINGVLFHMDNPSAGDAASHDNWLAEKRAAGWVYGPVKDEAKKEHPCMVPFEQLPPEQQAKDRLFRSIVHALLSRVEVPGACAGAVFASESELEAEIQAKGLTAPRITPPQVDALIVAEQFYVFPGTTLTVCALMLRNGFHVTGTSAAASPDNFNAEIGRKIARENARNEIWELEGYRLRSELAAARAA